MAGVVATSQQEGMINSDKIRDGEQIRRTGTQADGDPSAEQCGQQVGTGSGGKDHPAGDGSAGDGHEAADRRREADPGDADHQRGSRSNGAFL